MATLAAELDEIEEGHVSIRAPIRPGARQRHGFAHAGLTFAQGDSAAGYSASRMMDEVAEVQTAEMDINLLAPGRGNRLIVRGRLIQPAAG